MLIEEDSECRGAVAIIEILQFRKFIDLQIRIVDLYSHAFLSFIVARATGVEIIRSIECSMGIIFLFQYLFCSSSYLFCMHDMENERETWSCSYYILFAILFFGLGVC